MFSLITANSARKPTELKPNSLNSPAHLAMVSGYIINSLSFLPTPKAGGPLKGRLF